MTEFTPIPGVWYREQSDDGEGDPDGIIRYLYAPMHPKGHCPWWNPLENQWVPREDIPSDLVVDYNPHGDVQVKVQWGTLDDDNGGEFEPEVTYGEGYHWEPFTKEEAKERARLYKEPFVTRTVTTITHTTEWTEVTENE